MRKYVIFTDSCADLTAQTYRELGVRTIQMEVIMEGEAPVKNDQVDIQEVYAKLRAKQGATTSAINLDRFLAEFGAALEAEDVDILYLGFSSGLSSTFGASVLALQELSEKYPDRKLYAVDTLCASMGQGLLVYLAARLQQTGADIDTVKYFVENNKLNLCHWFTVDDLFFLKRGGRVSAASAVVGSLLQIKPVLHVDNAGKLINVLKARGRKAAIEAMVQKMKATMFPDRNKTVFISHGDCIDDAKYLADRITAEFGIKDVQINFIGPVIGSHSGPGTLALFFLGTER